jgi:hypothetical protein
VSGKRLTLAPRLKRVVSRLPFVRLLRSLSTPHGRGVLRATVRGGQLFQPATMTWMDRHPGLFALARETLADRPAPRLLSFGCSTGEEAFTLAHYFPTARIDAIDANPACIAQARQRGDHPAADRIRFVCGDAISVFAAERYDAIFCLSVLRHGDLEALQPERCTGLLPFARFAAMVEAFDRQLLAGGLLVLWGCQFRFTDTNTALGYSVVPSPGVPAQQGPFYGPDDRRIADTHCAAFVFAKPHDAEQSRGSPALLGPCAMLG